jgi:hypothetical protein
MQSDLEVLDELVPDAERSGRDRVAPHLLYPPLNVLLGVRVGAKVHREIEPFLVHLLELVEVDDDGGGADWLYLWGVGRGGAVLSTCMLGLGEGPTISCTLSSVPSGQYFLMTHNWFCCGYIYPNTKAAGISGVARLGMGFMITWSVSRMST